MPHNDEIIQIKMNEIKNQLFHLTNLMPYAKIRVEYNRNKKINDGGKLEISFHFNQYCS